MAKWRGHNMQVPRDHYKMKVDLFISLERYQV